MLMFVIPASISFLDVSGVNNNPFVIISTLSAIFASTASLTISGSLGFIRGSPRPENTILFIGSVNFLS